jgi:nitrogen fixation-related uncharacterized protein
MARKTLVLLIIIAVALAALVAGFLWGKDRGQTTGEEQYRYLVDRAYPKPPPEMTSLSGTIKAIYGATIDLEIIDPDDYLPHPDGSPQKKEIRFVTITGSTNITLTDYTEPGYLEAKPLTQSDIKVGDIIKVTSNKNIRDAEKFDAHAIEVIRY